IPDIVNHQVCLDVGPPFLDPALGQDCLGLSNLTRGEKMALYVVRLVNVWFHQRDLGNARVSTQHVKDRHSAATCTDLNQMSHGQPPSPESCAPVPTIGPTLFHLASGKGHSPVSCQIS